MITTTGPRPTPGSAIRVWLAGRHQDVHVVEGDTAESLAQRLAVAAAYLSAQVYRDHGVPIEPVEREPVPLTVPWWVNHARGCVAGACVEGCPRRRMSGR
jgi:hypothetical protein